MKKEKRPLKGLGLEHMDNPCPVIPSKLTSSTLRGIDFLLQYAGGAAISLLPVEESITNMNLGVCCWMLRRFLSFEFEILCFWRNNQVLGASGPSTLSFFMANDSGVGIDFFNLNLCPVADSDSLSSPTQIAVS
ncbi:hypothetical protein POM88_014538 [Heracleum sosnowskyi]|uniref:Uncharacterized protein n=1 Tax=Heracleum sosnowskyi TaxID=360622 RepID=A0AAD8J0K2_9APIA|nr:hypothetical protein POM88_030548 [Heracleum sosnowskyi]KAK1395482.1 hypothetical protein POM88_014538 [Heracleum sosnowskyi]